MGNLWSARSVLVGQLFALAKFGAKMFLDARLAAHGSRIEVDGAVFCKFELILGSKASTALVPTVACTSCFSCVAADNSAYLESNRKSTCSRFFESEGPRGATVLEVGL